MQPQESHAPGGTTYASGCANCGSAFVESQHPTKLCYDCRQRFIRFPIPLWIKLFGIGIGLVVIFSLFSFPKQLSLRISLKKAKSAMEQHKFVTAQKELEKFVAKAPSSQDGHVSLAIASFYNGDMQTLVRAYDKLQGRKMSEDDLSRISQIGNRLDHHVPGPAFQELLKEYNDDVLSVPDSVYHQFLTKHPNDTYACLYYASRFFDKGRYREADSILTHLIDIDEQHLPALGMLANLKRRQDSLDQSIRYCDAMLGINTEYVYALSSKARALLKLKKEQEALSLARQAFSLKDDDGYTRATLVLIYHFTKQTNQRDEMLKASLSMDSSIVSYVKYAKDVIDGKETF